MGEILSTLKRKLLIDCNSLSTNLSKYPEKRRKTQKGLFRKRALQKRLCCAKETYNFKEPTNRNPHTFQNTQKRGKKTKRGTRLGEQIHV